MWARIIEAMLGCWLVISPFIFRIPTGETFIWASNIAAGVALLIFSLASIWQRADKLHLMNLAVAGYLMLISYLAGTPPPPAPYQNFMVIALLLLVVAIIPTRATLPPRSWQEFYERRRPNSNE